MRYVESLNSALHQLMTEDQRVCLIGEDLLDPYGGAFKVAKGLSTAFPNQVITTPISEASITGIGIGMAMRGQRPIVEIMFGDFLALCADQIVNHASKFRWMYNDQAAAPLVIRTPMGGRRGYGATHSQTLESMFQGVPDLLIHAPSHYHDPGALLRSAVHEDRRPVLFIENKLLYARELAVADEAGRIGHFHVQSLTLENAETPTILLSLAPEDAPDATLIAYGGMAPFAVDAAYRAFVEEEITVEVLLPSAVKPVPIADLLPSVRRSGRVVIAEEGNLTGGWGAEVSCQIYDATFDALRAPIKRVATPDSVLPSARSLETEILPSDANIVAALYSLF